MEYSDGTLIAGRYRLVMRLGGGGMGEVWKARDERLEVDVAAKRLVVDPYATPAERRTALAYAVKESRHAAALRTHPNVAAVHDVVEDDSGTPWTVMDLVSGRSLAQALAANERFTPDAAARIGREVASALDAAHAAGIMHRDVKPSNVMLTLEGRVLLLDFGIAKHPEDTRITRTGMAVGTVEYMSPERFDGADAPAGDMWALGVTLYELVEGSSPFRRNTMMATIRAISTEEPQLSVASGRLGPTILRLLEKAPEARPTAGEVRELLRDGLLSDAGSPTRTADAQRPPHIADEPPPQDDPPKPPPTPAGHEQFERAALLADSIEDPDHRTAALVKVLGVAPWLLDDVLPRIPKEFRAMALLGLAARSDDPAQVARLIDEARKVIPRMTDPAGYAAAEQEHGRQSARLAGMLAATDPYGARRLMERAEARARLLAPVTNSPFALPQAMAQIAVAGRSADPHCARRLFDAAEVAARSVEDEGDRAFALRCVADEAARVDPERAVRIIGSMANDHRRRSAWTSAIEAAADAGHGHARYLIDMAERTLVGPPQQTEPTGIRRLFGPAGQPSLVDTGGLVDIAVAAAADPRRAGQLVARITVAADRVKALVGMAGKIGSTDPAQARDWLEAAGQAALRLEAAENLGVLGEFVEAAAPLAPALARDVARHLLTGLGIAPTTKNLVHSAGHLAALDVGQALRLVDHVDARGKKLSVSLRADLAENLLKAAVAAVETDPQLATEVVRRACEIVHQPPELTKYVSLVWRPLNALAKQDPDSASLLIDQLPGPERDPLVSEVVTTLARTDPMRAEQLAQSIGDPSLRKQALVTAVLGA
ncbi:serine/threonine-protein kinase [Yinghuangia seranimata]|uniref:serine/threonine-protein kinase n=1 Tax=Yinghuangia seranimata TaxID=408067 RepID=UPI00248C7ED8|nr:serine/threonine-protein kinase [Yinghuangia seranimata]MDI2129994.1 serine/threonine-protein kinase [Yinghuangia seranimata]